MGDSQKILDIILKTKSTGDSAKPLVSSLTDIKSGLDMITAAYNGVAQMAQDAWNATAQKAIDYNLEIRKLSENLGIGTEETSRIIQAMDDFGVEADQVKTALQMAVKNGFAPSIESIAQLADQYNGISDPIARAEMLTEKFGRNWSVLTPALRAGGSAIRAAAADISGSLVVTEQAAQRAEDYRKALDSLKDSSDEFGMTLGNSVIPKATAFMDLLNNMGSGMKGSDAAASFLNSFFKGTFLVKAGIGDIPDDSFVEKFKRMQKAVEDIAPAADESKAKFEELGFVLSGDVTNQYEQFGEKNQELSEKAVDLKTKLEDLSHRTPWKTDDIAAVKEQLREVNQAIQANKEAQEEANKATVFGLLQQKVLASDLPKQQQADLLFAIADRMGLVGDKEDELWKQTDNWVKKLGDAQLMAMATGQAINDIPGYKQVIIEITTIGGTPSKLADVPMSQLPSDVTWHLRQPVPGKAAGGPVSAGNLYVVGEQGPELFIPDRSGRIAPNRGTGKGQGLSLVVNGTVQFNLKDQKLYDQLMEQIGMMTRS